VNHRAAVPFQGMTSYDTQGASGKVPLGRRRAGRRDQVRLLPAVEPGAVAPSAAAVRAQGRREALLDEPPLEPLHGGEADARRVGDAVIRSARPILGLVRLEQDASMPELAHVSLATPEQLPDLRALLAG
jgi:hypothetical protein